MPSGGPQAHLDRSYLFFPGKSNFREKCICCTFGHEFPAEILIFQEPKRDGDADFSLENRTPGNMLPLRFWNWFSRGKMNAPQARLDRSYLFFPGKPNFREKCSCCTFGHEFPAEILIFPEPKRDGDTDFSLENRLPGNMLLVRFWNSVLRGVCSIFGFQK